jgi:hypothetical protein
MSSDSLEFAVLLERKAKTLGYLLLATAIVDRELPNSDVRRNDPGTDVGRANPVGCVNSIALQIARFRGRLAGKSRAPH